MKMLHTADWHIGANWKGIDRAADLLERAVPDIVALALQERVDLVLIAGDVFERQTVDSLQQAADTLAKPFRELLDAWIDVALLVGNHDSPPLFRVLRSAIELVGSVSNQRGQIHVLNAPWVIPNLRGIQLLNLPYLRTDQLLKVLHDTLPEPETSAEMLNWELGRKLDRAATELRGKLDNSRPALLAYHGVVQGATIGVGSEEWEMTYNQSYMLSPDSLLRNDQVPQYNALGHIHKVQELAGVVTTWYSGSPDRLNQGEKDYTPSVILVEFPAKSRRVETECRALPRPTPFLDVEIQNERELRALADKLGDEGCRTALGRVILACDPSNAYALDQTVRETFPRLKNIKEAVLRPHPQPSTTNMNINAALLQELQDPGKTIRSFIEQAIPESQRPTLLNALELVERELSHAN